MQEIIPSINNFPIFLHHFWDLGYDQKKKPKPLKNDSLGTCGILANFHFSKML